MIHQQLGVRPSLGTGALEIVPQVPAGQSRVAGADIRLGEGDADVRAEHKGDRWTTTVTTDAIELDDLRVGTTLPAGHEVATVTLDGARVSKPTVRETDRGVEVTAKAPPTGRHVVVVTAA